MVTGRGDMFDGVDAMNQHLKANTSVPDSFSVFGYIDEKGKPQHMVKKVLTDFCSDIWEKAQLDRVTGHSFRIGGVVALLLAGVDPNIVAATGGWTSLAFLLYWRRTQDVIPIHIHKAYESQATISLDKVIKAFQKSTKISDRLIDSCIAGEEFAVDNLHDV